MSSDIVCYSITQGEITMNISKAIESIVKRVEQTYETKVEDYFFYTPSETLFIKLSNYDELAKQYWDLEPHIFMSVEDILDECGKINNISIADFNSLELIKHQFFPSVGNFLTVIKGK